MFSEPAKKEEPEESAILSAKERRKIRRQERKARQKLGHGGLLNPDTARGAEVAEDCNLKGEPGKVGMNRDPAAVQPPGQRFACISWVAPHSTPQRAKCIAIKLRGVFHTKDEAMTHAAEVFKVDPDFDIHVVDMYEWLVVPPPMEHQSQIPMEYNQAKLDRIMKGYYKQIRDQKRKHDARVEAALKEGRDKATAWRKERGFDTSTSLTKELDPENPERVPVQPQPETSEGGFITQAAKGTLDAGRAVQEEMGRAGGHTKADLSQQLAIQVEREKAEAVEFEKRQAMHKALEEQAKKFRE